ncbi:alpha/beta fold hydrolase [Carboxylicivirga sp. N1Y90]|uniref:alpha/beta fold hydrolase n=1 Tax=Carboxylicivirga fragile TaxID=3417571 RepID=UPI003D33EC11|nr:alpha/beta hydrolase [Marinilabiliaceae bacterium N1Y90]
MSYFTNPHKIDIKNQSLVYYRMGKGEPLLFIHGITTYSFIWRQLIPLLIDKYELILVDLAGCGDSSKNIDDSLSIKNHAKMLHLLIEQLLLKNLHLISHDVGGGIAQLITVHYPHRIKSLTLINSVGYDFWPVQPIISMRTPIIRHLAMATLDMGALKFIIKRGLFHRKKLDTELMELFWKPLKTSEGRKAFLFFAHCLDNKNLLEISDELTKLKLPVLIIRGDCDVFLGKTISERLHKDIPNSQYEVISTGGHFIQEDEPELLAQNIHHFISNINE